MSGHSKWSQIKRQKGAADIKKGAAFSKLANAITIAAHNGGDPGSNFSLRMAIEKARAANMPKDNIERAVKRGTGELGGVVMEEVIYEAIGPGGIGLIVEAVTDNRNRTNSEIKNIFSKYNAKLASPGAVNYRFRLMGKLIINKSDDLESQELALIDAGVEDFEEENDSMVCYTKPNELEKIKRNLDRQGILAEEASLIWEPNNIIKIDDPEVTAKILKIMESLEGLNDVTSVFSNFDIREDLL